MKKLVQMVISIVVAISVSFTGMGVTVINCNDCTSCEKQYIFLVSQDVCFSSERQSCCSAKDEVHAGCCEKAFDTDKAHCSASRLGIDIDGVTFRPCLTTPFVWGSDTPFSFASDTFIVKESTLEKCLFKSPPNILPREYLSFIRVLII